MSDAPEPPIPGGDGDPRAPRGSTTGSNPLEREQAHLDRARRELARMRAKAETAEVTGGDQVSSEFLAMAMWRRAQALVDDPGTALFFGRLDLLEPTEGQSRWYVGRRHVSNAEGDPLVIDWRAPLSSAFYRATRRDNRGVLLRRRFGVDHGRLTAYEDEHLTDLAEVEGRSVILQREIERPRVGPMRDIVATIQPEQDVIVRADIATTVCIQGAPGTGKTAVGLHRAAWLLYAHRDRLARAGVLVIGPNAAFLDHIGAVLPALGEIDVRHSTAADLVSRGGAKVRAIDPVATAVLKGDARMATVLARAVRSSIREPVEALVVPRGARRWRVPTDEVREIVEDLRSRAVRYDAARAMLAHRLAHAVLVQMERAGDSPDDRVQDAVARSAPVRAYVASVWPALDPRAVLTSLFSDPANLARHSDGLLTEAEQGALRWSEPPRSKASAKWSAADLVLLDELADLLERTPSLGHVVLDEAQDLSPMQLRAVGRRCSTGSMTILGDIAQGTTAWATDSWADSLRHLGKPDGRLEVLDRGFRVPEVVIDYAARLLPLIAPGLGVPHSVREDPGRLELDPTTAAKLAGEVARVAGRELTEPGSVGVIVPDGLLDAISRALTDAGIEHGRLGADAGDVEHRLDVVPATVAKGLEFDRVVVVEPARIAADEPDERTGLRRLYVVLTRAVTALTIVHAEPLPAALAAAASAEV